MSDGIAVPYWKPYSIGVGQVYEVVEISADWFGPAPMWQDLNKKYPKGYPPGYDSEKIF
jgi:hypothetical protein